VTAARAAALGAAVALGLGGCTSTQAATMPIGVVVPPQDRGKPLVDGVYASSGERGDPCCWMGPRAHVRAQKDEAATDLAVEVYVPDLEPYRHRAVTLGIAVENGPVYRRCCLTPGGHTILVRLAPELRDRIGTLDVDLQPSESFVPRRGGDMRRLSILLVAVTFRSF